MEDKKSYLFIVQGEGRGHMTQALALQKILTESGHKVCAVLVGSSSRREIPSFFKDKVSCPLHRFESPNFVCDSKGRSVKILKTVLYNLLKLNDFNQNINKIDSLVRIYKPDVIINFYDLLAGIYMMYKRPAVKYYCIGHQYLMQHPDFTFPPGRTLEKFLIKLNTKMTAYKADKKLALSFREMPDFEKYNLKVVPPLLRNEVIEAVLEREDFILVYMVNSGYGQDIINWHKANPHVKLHCFWDKKDAPEELKINDTLTFHRINDIKFLNYMRKCKGYVSTAGFESICEAMYLQKPVMMIPTHGHYEQECNAEDAVKSKAGIKNTEFNISDFLNYLPFHPHRENTFEDWVNSGEKIFVEELTGTILPEQSVLSRLSGT